MATKFTKGQNVKVKAVVPAGPVEALRMDEDGNFFYQIKWVDEQGNTQTRWFEESELVDG
jgi:uncharacterized protein YodC (DUF2158 family)